MNTVRLGIAREATSGREDAGMFTLGPGFRVGHWTDDEAKTGCTVILPPEGNVTSCDIRGASPASRELVLLDPLRKLTEVHAVLLTGGSAFGLAAADGVMSWLAERDVGYRTPAAVVPIVPAAVIYDLAEGSAHVRPGPAQGMAACEAAAKSFEIGPIGAGTGATVGKWAGRAAAAPGGVGAALVEGNGIEVFALAVVNAVGDVLAPDGSVLAGSSAPDPTFAGDFGSPTGPPTNTVLSVVTVAAGLEKRDVAWLAARGSDGVTVSVRPAHTRYDGDVSFAIAAPGPTASRRDLDVMGHLATQAVAAAVRASVT